MEGTSSGNQLCSHCLCATRTHTHRLTYTCFFLPPHTHTSDPSQTRCPSLHHTPSEWQLLNCDKRAVSGPPPYLGDWLNDLSITQQLLYSPSTDRVTRTATKPICLDQCHRRCHQPLHLSGPRLSLPASFHLEPTGQFSKQHNNHNIWFSSLN